MSATITHTVKPRRRDTSQHITPDLIVERVGEEYVVFLNDKNVPRLRISTAYKRELDRAPVNVRIRSVQL